MTIYCFRTKDGRAIDADFPPHVVPKFGQWREIEGVLCRRIYSFRVGTAAIERSNGYPYLSNGLPTTTRGCRLVADPKTGRKKPMIENRQHEREVMAKNDLVKESATYDGDSIDHVARCDRRPK